MARSAVQLKLILSTMNKTAVASGNQIIGDDSPSFAVPAVHVLDNWRFHTDKRVYTFAARSRMCSHFSRKSNGRLMLLFMNRFKLQGNWLCFKWKEGTEISSQSEESGSTWHIFLVIPIFHCQLKMVIFPTTKVRSEVLLQGEFMLPFESSVTDYNFKAVLIAISTYFILRLATGVLAGDILWSLITEYRCRW